MTHLYLNKEKDIQLKIDGPALVVQCDGQADRLFPLQRLEQVMVHAALEVSSRVLIACARAGVTLCFADARQNPVMWCLPQTQNEQGIGRCLQKFMQRADWESLFQEWQNNDLQRLLPALARQMKLPTTASKQEVQAQFKSRAIRYAGEDHAQISARWLETELQSMLVTLLRTLGADAADSLFWAGQLTPLLRWRMEGARLHWLGQRYTRARNLKQPVPTLTQKEFMNFFSPRKEALYAAANDLLQRFSLWLQHPANGE